ncbi:MAG: transcriptional regulator NrdR [Clostridia bacterium]|nr:transcriptional regulator NrdR [Clostridia bacterium]MBO7289110.1 transcriptional regulator NrdR [Clostridia bacterium]
MRCPYCDYLESKVIDSRPIDDGSSIRRRRECLKCEKRFTTYEQVESVPLIIIKKDGKRQTYNRQKLLNGILRACEKTPVTFAQVEGMVLEIESILNSSLEREISSTQIGELVMDKLKKINDIAYVRFASVYREFRDINSFMEELLTLNSKKD